MSSILRSSKFVRYFFGQARSIIISNRQGVDSSLLQSSRHLAGVSSSNFSSNQLNVKPESDLEQIVRRLDEDARRSGRLSKSEIEDALSKIKNYKQATSSQSLMVIRCCGNLVPEETPEQRTNLVKEIWNTFEKIGVALDISHYNALLKVYLENEHKFSPIEFLAKLEKNGIDPNRVTYQRLIAGYCQQGDIAGATKILEFMKEKQLPVTEGVFNALILGHSKADDMESAEGILSVMRQANLDPSNETYTTLLCGYARRGDKAALERLITEAKVKDILLSDRDILEVAYAATVSGHEELVDEILENVRHMTGYNQEAANVLLRLITAGKDEVAYKIFKTLHSAAPSNNQINMSGHIFIKQLVKVKRPVDQIMSWCERLEKDGHTDRGLWIAINASFHHNPDLTIDLLRVLKSKGESVRTHYFWPSLVSAGKANNLSGMNDILKTMISEFETSVTSETLRDYYLPHVRMDHFQQILDTLMGLGVRRGQAVVGIIGYLISNKQPKEALELAYQFPGLNMKNTVTAPLLVELLVSTGDVASVVGLVHVLTHPKTVSVQEDKDEEEDEERDNGEDITGRFLVNLVSFAPSRKYTVQVLQEMLNLGLSVTISCAEAVTNRLQGSQLTPEISEMLTKLSSGELIPQPIIKSSLGKPAMVKDPLVLEKRRQQMKENNEPEENIIKITRTIYQLYCYKGDLENALRIKKEWTEELKQDMSPGMWAVLLDAYCSNKDLNGAKDCLDKIKSSEKEFELDRTKILRMAKLLIENNQFEEAISLLKSVKPREKDTEASLPSRIPAWQALQAAADTTKDPEKVKELLTTICDLKYSEINNALLGPVIKAYLLRDDLEGALKEFGHCVNTYRLTPYKNELTTRLIEKEDATNLQTLVDWSTQVHGEINSLYDLVFSFIECGRIRQARKILETPGLSVRNNRLNSVCERYRNEGMIAPLEGLVEATKDLPHIDRSEIYYSLLDTYCKADDVEKALGLWTKMQDEDVAMSDEFLVKLGNFLKEKNVHVPFEIPKLKDSTSDKQEIKVKPTRTKQASSPLSSSLVVAIRSKNADEALKIKDDLENNGQHLTSAEISRLIELLVEKNRLQEATNLLVKATDDQMPNSRVLNFLITRLAAAGNIDLMKTVGERLPEDLKKVTSFSNRFMGAAVISGQTRTELDRLEKEIDEASTPEQIDSLAVKFPRGGIQAVLESSPDIYEQVVRIIDKYYSKGVSSPANCLVTFHLTHGEKDKASKLFQHYNLANSSQLMFRNVLSKARIEKNPQFIEDLLALIKDAPCTTPEIKGIIYSNLINVHVSLEQYEEGLAKLEEALKTVPIDMMYPSSLTNLKNGLESKNIPFQYIIPPKKVKDSSSSSSSSETESKKSAARN